MFLPGNLGGLRTADLSLSVGLERSPFGKDTMSLAHQRKHVDRKSRPYINGVTCPVCRGTQKDHHHGNGTRCFGYLTGDGEFAYCTQVGTDGQSAPSGNEVPHRHRMKGKCECGQAHWVDPVYGASSNGRHFVQVQVLPVWSVSCTAQVVRAAQQPDDPKSPFETALDLLERGFWPVPIYPPGVTRRDGTTTEGKEPIGKAWGAERWTPERLKGVFQRYPDAGGGICLGPERGPGKSWLADIEGDGDPEETAKSLGFLFGGAAPDTMGWSSTRGGHSIFTVDGERLLGLLEAAGGQERAGRKVGTWHLDVLPGLEIRVGGAKPTGEIKQCQSVCPPTGGTDGQPRVWNATREPVALPEAAYEFLEGIADALEERRAIMGEPALEQPAPARKLLAPRNGDGSVSPRLYEAILSGECVKVAKATVKHRNDTLNKVAFTLGGHLGRGKLERTVVEQALRAAAQECGLPEGEVMATIQSGLDAGTAVPFPEPRAKEHPRGGQQKKAMPRQELTLVEAGDPEEPASNRIEIEMSTERHRVRDESVKALARDKNLFALGDVLARVVRPEETETKLDFGVQLRNANNPRICTVDDPTMGCLLTQHVDFYKWRVLPGGEQVAVSVHPTDWLIRAILARKTWPGIRPLLTFTECPYLNLKGEVVTTEGYDPSTGTLLIPAFAIEPLPKRVTKADAQDAYARIYQNIKDFPFEEGGHSADIWFADVLTMLQRPIISGPVPGFAYIGNKAGTGKGLLINCKGMLVSGAPVPAMDYPTSKEEASKTVLAIALGGLGAIHFDNLEDGQGYGNGPLDSALTKTVAEGRILGLSKMAGKIPLRCCWTLSGNNLSPTTDAFRRWLPCNLITKEEFPHERTDCEIENLQKHFLDQRSSIVRDFLIILKAYAQSGKQVRTKAKLGSFEEWDTIVRAPLEWATGRDLLTTQRKAAIESPARLKKVALIEAWKTLPDGGPSDNPCDDHGHTAAEALKLVNDDLSGRLYAQLREALLLWGSRGELPSSTSLGYILRGLSEQNHGGFFFKEVGKLNHVVVWKIFKA
jgi:hypothetical protein